MRVVIYFRGRATDSMGTPLRCRNLALGLARQADVEVKLVSRDEPEKVQALMPGVAHCGFDAVDQGANALRNCVATWRPDVVYGQTHRAAPDVASVPAGSGAARVVDLHGDLPAYRLEQTWRSVPWRLFWYARGRADELRHFPRLDGFTVVSEPLERRIRWLRKPVAKVWGGAYLPSQTDPPVRERVNVVYAGNYNPYHGIGTVLEAAEELVAEGAPFHFTLVGNIGKFPDMERAARELGDAVTLVGLVPYEDVARYLSDADVLVIPRASSRTAETTYPSKLSEYLATGRAVVATDVGEIGRVVRDGEHGLVVPPEAPGKLAAALRRLEDRELRVRLGANARALAEQTLSWDQICAQVVSFFQTVRPN